jgi:hypothetical protein
MANEFDDLSKIRHVKPGDPVAAKPTSQPTRAIEIRLQQLESLIESLSQSSEFSKLIIRDVAIKTGDEAVVRDDIVYFNPNTGLYEKAEATVTFAAGLYTTNPSGLAIGVCVATNGSVGDIMIAGYDTWRDDAHHDGMMETGEEYIPGHAYFLSAIDSGKLTRFPPTMRIQIMIGTDKHYVLEPLIGNPDSLDTPIKQPVGMRPVGAVRKNPPNQEQFLVVGFDGIELQSEDADHLGYGAWLPTDRSLTDDIAKFGYMVADSVVNIQPVNPVYIRAQVAVGGAIRIFQSPTLADLADDNSNIYNVLTSLTALSSNKELVRSYTVLDVDQKTVLGTIYFKFTSNDTTYRRDVIFKFPDAFQGWKMVNAPVTPIATAIIANGGISSITVLEGGVGYDTAPDVIITGDGTGATATAVLDETGSVMSVIISSPGIDYTTATVTFDDRLASLTVVNGGSGGAGTATATGPDDGIDTATISTGGRGSGYLSAPSVEVTDSSGLGTGAIVQASVRNGEIIEFEIADRGENYVDPRLVIRPAANFGYQKTKVGVYDVVISGGVISSVTPHAGGNGLNHPIGCRLVIVGDGSGATIAPVLGPSGEVTSVNVLTAGTSYTTATVETLDVLDPLLVLIGGDPTSPGNGTLTVPAMSVERIEIIASGIGYTDNAPLTIEAPTVVGGITAAATIRVDDQGRIIKINLYELGSGYEKAPDITLPAGGTGSILTPQMGAPITAATVTDPGSGYDAPPAAYAGVPVHHVEVDEPGTGYASTPLVSFRPPDMVDGVQAQGVAVMGGQIAEAFIITPGAGYTEPENWSIVVSGGGGSGAVLNPLISGGELVGIEIVDPGHDYTSIPTLTLTPLVATPGSGATLEASLEGVGSVVGVTVTVQGSGYISPPPITINPPTTPDSKQARATAKMVGDGAMLLAAISGNGSLPYPQAAVQTTGNAMQIYDFGDDLNDSAIAVLRKPQQAPFYYNIKADPLLKVKYPSIPPEKSMFILNGTEMLGTAYNESTGRGLDPEADVVMCRRSPLWTTFDVQGSPWDLEYRQYVADFAAAGRDHVIPKAGPFGFEDSWLRYWEHVFKDELNRNRGWLHINRGSRFYQTGRVSSIAVLAPLRVTDVTTGADAKTDGSPLTGQLLLSIDGQATFLTGNASVQVDLSKANNLVTIYKNNTGRPVMISSVVLSVAYQLNVASVTPTVADTARVTVGTQLGNYRDIIGTIDPSLVTQQGAETKLYVISQVKELFPDARDSAPLIMPGQEVFLRVDATVSTNILTQLVLTRIRGYLF